MENNNEQRGWTKGYPSPKMIKANESRLWLVKTKNGIIETLKIYSPPTSLGLLLKEQYYVCAEKKHIIVKNKNGYYYDSVCDEQLEPVPYERIFLFWEGGYFENIYEEYEHRVSVKGKIDLETFLITDTFTDINEYDLHIADELLQEVPNVIKLFHETGELKQTIKQKDKQWENTYFCPIDNDGNKITVIPKEE
jgi:hypothetical protein